MSGKNLVLTILHHYNYPLIEPFIKSLKEVGYKDDLVVFISDTTSKTTRKILQKQGITLVEFKNQYPFIGGYEDVFEDISPDITINNYRFLLFFKYLVNNPGKYKNVMLTDIRDVIFQKNIFDELADDKIYYFLEDASEVFRTSTLNHKWCLHANGPEITNQIIDENVSCAGITIGSYEQVINYLLYLQSRLKFRDDLHWGLDQGLHNAYIYTIPNQSAVIVPNTQPLILTLGACKTFKWQSNGELVNDLNERYSVVHQWDRFGDLIVSVKRKYVGNRLMQRFKKALFTVLP